MGQGKKPRHYDDLDKLAGTWSLAEAAKFDAAVKDFEQIESDLWGGA